MTDSGIINVYKLPGQTSQRTVSAVKHLLRDGCDRNVKVGHAGTLDPLAEGVLPILFGAATKLFDAVSAFEKCYTTDCVFGKTTDTQDANGAVLSEQTPNVAEADLRRALSSFVGGYMQKTPLYSARHINGERMYDLARKGVHMEQKTTFAPVYGIALRHFTQQTATFTVLCGKGVYVRTIVHDLGALLGCGAYMSYLRRDCCGGLHYEDALTVDALRRLSAQGRLEHAITQL